jgi:hypothetical protein
MKRKTIKTLLTTLLLPCFSFAQTTEPSTVWGGIEDGGTGASSVLVPFDPTIHVAGKTTSSPFVAVVSSTINTNHPDWLGPINKAVSTWGQILSTTHSVQINFHSSNESGYALPSYTIASGKPAYDAPNFTATVSSSAYFPNTYYVGPLACYMSNGVTASGWESQIDVVINEHYVPNAGFNTNTDNGTACPLNQYDLTTACMQAIGSGVGLLSETNNGSSIQFAHTNQWPNIFEHFITDNGTGSSAGTVTWLRNLTGGLVGSFVTGHGSYVADATYSNSAFFKGPTSPLVKLYIPTTYMIGRNLCYADQASAPPTTLMIPALPTGRKVLVPSVSEIKMLNDIGWSASNATVGVTDNVNIIGGYGNPLHTTLDLGSSYSYSFIDIGPVYGLNSSTGNYTLELLDETGWVIWASHYGDSYWDTPPLTLPGGTHNWVRDINGNIQGRLSASCSDNGSPSVTRSSSIDIGIRTAPETPIFNIENITNQDGCCATKKVNFYAAGADSYEILSREFVGGAWTTWSITTPAPGDHSFIFTGLDQTISHQFNVVAHNSTGSSTSNQRTTNPCIYNITASPNPVDHNTLLHIDGDQSFLITNITISDVRSGQSVASIGFDGTKSSVVIDLTRYQLQPGTYVVAATATPPFDPSNCFKIDYTKYFNAATEIQTSY